MIKLFEQFKNEQEIHDICKNYTIKNYTINSDGSIDVDGDVNLMSFSFENLPLKFNKVSGSFDCSDNKLTSLIGSPKEVGGDFYCYNNQLTSLIGSPKEVGGGFDCYNNQLTSLEGSPERVGGFFYCNYNQLTSLEGSPKEVGDVFYCFNNQLTSLEGSPERVGGNFVCYNNQLTSLKGSPMIIYNLNLKNNPISIIDTSIEIKGYIIIDDTKFDDKIKSLSQDRLRILFEHGVDYDIFKKDGTINDSRLERMFKDFNL